MDPEHDTLPDRIAYFGDVGGPSSTVRPACANDDSLTGLAHAWRPAATGPTVERTVGLFLLPEYSRFEYHALIETFKKANEVLSGVRYDVVAIESEGETCTDPTASVEPIALPGLLDAAACDCLIVLGGSLKTWSKGVAAHLRRHHRHGGMVAALSAGVLTLVRSGLLDGRRCAAHWYLSETVQDLSSRVELSPRMVELDGRCLTCAGGVATLDLVLTLIAEDLGFDAAQIVAEAFCHSYSSVSYPQPVSLRRRLGTPNRHLVNATKAMAESLESNLTRSEIASRAGVSVRQLERLFRRHLGTSPLQFYREMRLRRARRLLRESDLSVTEIAYRTGYVSASHFAQSYRNHYGIKPSQDR